MVGGRGGKSPFSTHKSPCTPWRFKVKGVEKAGSKQTRSVADCEGYRQRKPGVMRSLKQAFDSARVEGAMSVERRSSVRRRAWGGRIRLVQMCAPSSERHAGSSAGQDISQLAQNLSRSLCLQLQQPGLEQQQLPQQAVWQGFFGAVPGAAEPDSHQAWMEMSPAAPKQQQQQRGTPLRV